MSLSIADIASIKDYINGRYSEAQLIRWTNPDTTPMPTTIDDDVYTNMINSAYQMYLAFYSPTFSVENDSAMDKLCLGVILTMENWRSSDKYKHIQDFYVTLKKGKVRQIQIVPFKIENTNIRFFDSRDPDSPNVSYQGTVTDEV